MKILRMLAVVALLSGCAGQIKPEAVVTKPNLNMNEPVPILFKDVDSEVRVLDGKAYYMMTIEEFRKMMYNHKMIQQYIRSFRLRFNTMKQYYEETSE